MKTKRKVYANILCDAAGTPFKMIVTDGQNTYTIAVTNSTLKTCKMAAKNVYDATEIFFSLIHDAAH